MTFNIPAHPGRLAATALLAATFAVGGSAVVNPAIACAAPHTEEYDDAGYQVCARAIDDAWAEGTITVEQHEEELEKCCLDRGGLWTPAQFARCTAPEIRTVPGAAVEQPTDAATLPPPPPPRLPVVPQPSDNATVTPQPAAPPTTSTLAPPPPLR